MIKELVKDEAILSQVCTPATTDDAQVADDLVETLTSMEGVWKASGAEAWAELTPTGLPRRAPGTAASDW